MSSQNHRCDGHSPGSTTRSKNPNQRERNKFSLTSKKIDRIVTIDFVLKWFSLCFTPKFMLFEC